MASGSSNSATRPADRVAARCRIAVLLPEPTGPTIAIAPSGSFAASSSSTASSRRMTSSSSAGRCSRRITWTLGWTIARSGEGSIVFQCTSGLTGSASRPYKL